jgi:ribosomal protein S27AE
MLEPVPEPQVISGHPEEPLLDSTGNLIQMLTVCAHCGNVRTILFLTEDRWYCSSCRMTGIAPPRLYPVS